MKNPHDKSTCWLCLRNHSRMKAACVADVQGVSIKTILNGNGRHFKALKDGGLFYSRAQVEAHMRIVNEKGKCDGQCNSVFSLTGPKEIQEKGAA